MVVAGILSAAAMGWLASSDRIASTCDYPDALRLGSIGTLFFAKAQPASRSLGLRAAHGQPIERGLRIAFHAARGSNALIFYAYWGSERGNNVSSGDLPSRRSGSLPLRHLCICGHSPIAVANVISVGGLEAADSRASIRIDPLGKGADRRLDARCLEADPRQPSR